MRNEIEMERNKIGTAIQYFREANFINQSKLCTGLCSVATLSRIEAGERDADSFLLETLLERLGKTPNYFELILSDFDYITYQKREDIKNQIENNNYPEAERLLKEYENLVDSKIGVHKQFITANKAFINELQGGTIHKTIELLLEAIAYTVPDFKTNKIKDYYLSNSELKIIIDILQRMYDAGMLDHAKEILSQIMLYFDMQHSNEEDDSLYPKFAIIASKLYLQEKNLEKAINLCNQGLDKIKGSRKLDNRGELFYLKAQITEAMMKKEGTWVPEQQECLKLYLQAYYIFDFCEEHSLAEQIKNYIQEEYQWEGID